MNKNLKRKGNKPLALAILIFTILLVSIQAIPLTLKYFYPPKYAPKGYRVDFDSKVENASRAITLRDSGDKHTIGITQSAEDLSICNGEIKTIIDTSVCWGLKLQNNTSSDLIITWKKNGYTYIVKTNDSLSIDDVAGMISNL